MDFAVFSPLFAWSQWLSGEVIRDRSGDGGFGREAQTLPCPVFPSLPVTTKAAATECKSGPWHAGQLFGVKGFLDEQKRRVSPSLGE